MPRPKKKKRIFNMPCCNRFSPDTNGADKVILTLDELESIRLADLNGMDQSACAAQMDIARTTAQNIINSAHKKIADALVNGKILEIAGGDYEYVSQDAFTVHESCCSTITIDRVGGLIDLPKEIKNMTLAVTYDPTTKEIFQHFGKTEYFKVYNIDDKKIMDSKVVSTNGQGHGALAGVLQELGADTLICGGIGGGAQSALGNAGIKLFGGVAGDCDQAAEAFVAGTLQYQEDVHCDHHDHDDHHEGGCGHHDGGCGHHEGGCHH